MTIPVVGAVLLATWNSNDKSCAPAGLNNAPRFKVPPLDNNDCEVALSSDKAFAVGVASTQPLAAWSVRLFQNASPGRSEPAEDKMEYPSIVTPAPEPFVTRAWPVTGSTNRTS